MADSLKHIQLVLSSGATIEFKCRKLDFDAEKSTGTLTRWHAEGVSGCPIPSFVNPSIIDVIVLRGEEIETQPGTVEETVQDLRTLLIRLLATEDDTGCSEDLTVVGRAEIDALRKAVGMLV